MCGLPINGLSAKVAQRQEKSSFPVGIVEGFYGRPWSHEDRLEMIRFMGTIGMNHYCYAPKDDPYHRKKWREPYPEDEYKKLKELIRACQRARVTFCFAVSPGLDIEYSNPDEVRLLLDKLELLARDGVRAFALFFDDISSTFPQTRDQQHFHSFAEAHAYLANSVYNALREKYGNVSLIVCPTEYYHSDPTPYLTELAAKLHPSVPIVWTGLGVFSARVAPRDLLRIREVTGRKPFLWDNYPVNDWDDGHIFLGPIRNRTPLMPLNLAGYWSNPMNEAELSKIPLLTIADYFRSPEAYNPETSWRNALRRVGGTRAYPYLLRAADLMAGSFLSEEEGRVLCALVGDYFEAATPASVGSLREYLQQLLELETHLDRTLANRRLFEELRPSLKRLRLHVRNLQLSLRINEIGTTSPEAIQLRAQLQRGLVAVDTPVTAPARGSEEWNKLLRDETTVFEGNVADEIFATIQQSFFSRWTAETSPSLPRVMAAPPAWRGCFGEFAVDGNFETSYTSRNPWKGGEYLAFDWQRELPKGTAIEVSVEGVERWKAIRWPELAIEVSPTGARWSKIGTVSGASASVKTQQAFRFVRLRALQDTETRVVIKELAVR